MTSSFAIYFQPIPETDLVHANILWHYCLPDGLQI